MDGLNRPEADSKNNKKKLRTNEKKVNFGSHRKALKGLIS